MMKVASRNLQSTAYHEAGHAVLALRARTPFKYVTVVPTDDAAGHVMPDENRWIPRLELDDSYRSFR